MWRKVTNSIRYIYICIYIYNSKTIFNDYGGVFYFDCIHIDSTINQNRKKELFIESKIQKIDYATSFFINSVDVFL